jgi:hypothetical protein
MDGTVTAKSIRFWDVQTGQLLWTIPMGYGTPGRSVRGAGTGGSPFCPFAFSSESKLLTINADLNPILWDLTTKRRLREFSGYAVQVSSVAISADNNLVASGGLRGTIKLWNLQEGQQFKTLQGHGSAVQLVAFSNDSKILATGDVENTIKLWDIKTGKELRSLSVEDPDTQRQVEAIVPALYSGGPDSPTIGGRFSIFLGEGGRLNIHGENDALPAASLVSLGQDDWAVVTPDGLFDASVRARKFMHYMTGVEPIALEQMKDLYYVPGLLQKILKGSPLPKVELFSNQDLFPLVEYQPFSPNQKQLTLKLTNRGGGIGQVQILFNGKELINDARPKGFSPKSPNATIKIDLSDASVKVGEINRIEIVARNAAGSLSTRGTDDAEIVYKEQGNASNEVPHLYAIVAGISDYTGDKLKLRFAAKDAEGFAHALELGALKLINGERFTYACLRVTATTQASNSPPLMGESQLPQKPTSRKRSPIFVTRRRRMCLSSMLPGMVFRSTSIKTRIKRAAIPIYF